MTPSKLGSFLSSKSGAEALEAELPYCDGQPMSDSEIQFTVCAYHILEPLRRYHSDRDIYIACNMAVYYRRPVEGARFDLARALEEASEHPVALAPDIFAVRGVSKRARKSYQVQFEAAGPEFVIEVASASTVSRDLGSKRANYERYGVLEYLLYDPTDEDLLSPRLQYFVKAEGRFVRAELNERGRFFSEVLGLEFALAEDGLRFYERGCDSPLLRSDEVQEAERSAREAAERRERRALEAREAERQAKEAERQAKEEALDRERQERQAKEAALQELEELRGRLARFERASQDEESA